MDILTALLSSLFFGLVPSLAIAALLLPLLCQNVVVAFPRHFLKTQVALALLARPLLDLAARVWLLQPLLPLMIATPALGATFAGLVIYFLLSTVRTNANAAIEILVDNFSELNPMVMAESVRQSAVTLGTSLETFFNNTNFTEVFQRVQPPTEPFFIGFVDHPPMGYSPINPKLFDPYFSEAVRNLTISESTQQYIDAVNIAIVSLLEKADVSSFFNTTRIPPTLYQSFSTVNEALHDLAETLNFTELLTNASVPLDLQNSFNRLGTSMETVGHNLNLTELYESAMSSPATQDVFKKFHPLSPLLQDPAKLFQSVVTPAGTASWGGAFRAFIAWIPLPFHVGTGVYIFLVLGGIPLTLLMCAALQDGCAWLVTRRYEFNVPSAQRSASGWMIVAAISGLALATTEAFSYCVFYGLLYSFNLVSTGWLFVLLGHTLAAAPLRAASQMRIAEASVNRDVLKRDRPGFVAGFAWVALLNCAYNLWWTLSSVFLTTFSFIGFSVAVPVLSTQAIVGSLAVLWGRKICGRVLEDERRMIEDRERKRE